MPFDHQHYPASRGFVGSSSTVSLVKDAFKLTSTHASRMLSEKGFQQRAIGGGGGEGGLVEEDEK